MRDRAGVVALAGGTGFTGRRVAARLAPRVAALRCLVRATSDRSGLPDGVTPVTGDLDDPASLATWLDGCDGLVYTASMGFGHVPAVVAAASAAGVHRAVFVSTTGIFTRIAAASRAVRLAAEDAVRGSGLAWTIVRPTMIYGAPGDRNVERLVRLVATRPLVPVPGRGRHLLQPVHVDDLAEVLVAALETPEAVGRAYDVSGAEPLSLVETIEAVERAVGRRPLRLHLPLRPVAACLRLLESTGVRLRIRAEQVERLAEDKAFSHAAAARDLGFRPRTFESGVAEEARLLGLAAEGAA